MAWRPYENLISGLLDNRTPGKVTGWMLFHRRDKVPLRIEFDLKGDFHDDIRGCLIGLSNPTPEDRAAVGEESYVEGLAETQTGDVGDMTFGIPHPTTGNAPYVEYPYVEWYSEANGRVVLELDRSQVAIIEGSPWSAEGERLAADSHELMQGFMEGLAKSLQLESGQPVTAVTVEGPAGVRALASLLKSTLKEPAK